jgi:hypothetical protein
MLFTFQSRYWERSHNSSFHKEFAFLKNEEMEVLRFYESPQVCTIFLWLSMKIWISRFAHNENFVIRKVDAEYPQHSSDCNEG